MFLALGIIVLQTKRRKMVFYVRRQALYSRGVNVLSLGDNRFSTKRKKNGVFMKKKKIVCFFYKKRKKLFLFFHENIHCGCTLEISR